MSKIRDLEVDIKKAEAVSEVVVCFLGEGGNVLRSAGTGRRGWLRRGVDRNHSVVRDVAEPVGSASPPLHRISRNSDTVEGGAGPLGTTSGLRHREDGGTDCPHPIVELAAQQVPRHREERRDQNKVPGNEERGRERSEREKSSEDFRPGVRRETSDHNSEINVDGVDATVDALYTAMDKNRGSETRDTWRQENGGAPLGSAVGARPGRGGDDSSHREDASLAGRAVGIPVSFNNSNKPLAPDGREDAFPLVPGGVSEGIPQPPEIPIGDSGCGREVVG